MGRNNRTRRQQKQRQKKQKNNTRVNHKALCRLDEMLRFCDTVIISLENGEPPLPSIMSDWMRYPANPAADKLRVLLIGFIDYLFHGKEARGKLAELTPYQRNMKKTDLAWLYALLSVYCLLSEDALAHDDLDVVTGYLRKDVLQRNFGTDHQAQTKALCAPFYLFLWVAGRPVTDYGNLRSWLQDWLGDSPLHSLIPKLEKFLALKSPKPKQKTVKTLEAALGQIDWANHKEWQDGLGRLLTLFMQQQLNVQQRGLDTWHPCSHLSALGGLLETQATENWSQIRFEKTNAVTLNLLNRQIATEHMSYAERLQLEALKCRILGTYVHKESIGRQDFEQQLERLLNLMLTGVPPDLIVFAERCLLASCEWLAVEVGNGRLPPPGFERLRRLYHRRPDDYRVAVLVYLSTAGRKPALKNTAEINFHHIHFPLFIQGINHPVNFKGFLDIFYWPLTNESIKGLATQCCRKLFLGMNEGDARHNWEHWRQALFDFKREPFASIVRGQACEAETLFYIVLVAIDNQYDTRWLQADHVSTLVRSAADLLTKHASDFNEQKVIKLLNTLTNSKHYANLFHTWEPVLTIVSKIRHVDELQTFLRLALVKLSKQQDHRSDKYSRLYEVCRKSLTLRQYLPRMKKPGKRSNVSKSSPTPTLDLFGEL